jgi:hypothetical protein
VVGSAQGLRKKPLTVSVKIAAAGRHRTADAENAGADHGDDDEDAFEHAPRKKQRQTSLPGAPPVADKKAKTGRESGKVAASVAKKKITKAKPLPTKAKAKAAIPAAAASAVAPKKVELSPNGKRVRQATLGADGGLAKPADVAPPPVATMSGPSNSSTKPAAAPSLPDSDPIVDAKPTIPTADELFLDRMQQLFKCVGRAAPYPADQTNGTRGRGRGSWADRPVKREIKAYRHLGVADRYSPEAEVYLVAIGGRLRDVVTKEPAEPRAAGSSAHADPIARASEAQVCMRA